MKGSALAEIDGLGCMFTDEVETRKQRRNIEDEAALGGLRNPHRSVSRLEGAPACGARLKEVIDRVTANESLDSGKLLATLGQAEELESTTNTAAIIRQELCKHYGVEVGAGQAQGHFRGAIAKDAGPK